MLGGEVFVGHVLAQNNGSVDQRRELSPKPGLAAVGLGQGRHGLVGGITDRHRVQPQTPDQGQHDALVLTEQRSKQVIRGDLGVCALPGRGLGGLDGIAGQLGPGIGIEGHVVDLSVDAGWAVAGSSIPKRPTKLDGRTLRFSVPLL